MTSGIWQLYAVVTAFYVAGALAVASVPVSVVLFVQWWRLTPTWPPAAATPVGSVGGGPYRGAVVDTRLWRSAPVVVRVTTLTALLLGEVLLAVSLVSLTWCVVLGGSQERGDVLLANGLGAVTMVVVVAALRSLRVGSSLLMRAEQAAERAGAAAGWAMGAGVSLFALLFGILGGAVGQHQGWLCLTLLVGSLVCIVESLLLRQSVEAIDS